MKKYSQRERVQEWKFVAGGWVLGAPQWLKNQMEALRKQPKPSIEKVRAQMAASAEWQTKYGFECVERIKKAKVIR